MPIYLNLFNKTFYKWLKSNSNFDKPLPNDIQISLVEVLNFRSCLSCVYRAALLTGRYQTRSGVWPGVFIPSSTGGLPHNEVTIAEILQPLNYSTAIVGKWHLGAGKDGNFLPIYQGFDEYYGIPYSHDMCFCSKCFYPNDRCFDNCDTQYSRCPLYHGKTIIEQELTIQKGYNQIQVDVQKLAQGNCFVEITGSDWKITSEQFVKMLH